MASSTNIQSFFKRLTVFRISLLLFVAVLASCANTTGNDSSQKELVIGWAGPLTGFAASMGIDNLRGIEIAVQELNKRGGVCGTKLRLVIEDDQLDPKILSNAFNKLVAVDNAVTVFAPSPTGAVSLAPQAFTARVPVIDSLDTSEEIASAGDWLFGAGINDEAIGQTLAQHAQNSLHAQRAGIIYNSEDQFMKLVHDEFIKKFVQNGGIISGDEAYLFETADFRTSLAKIVEQKPDVIVVLGYDESGFIVKQARDLSTKIPLLGSDTWASKNFVQNAGGTTAVEGTVFTYWSSNTNQYDQFLASFQKRYNATPDQPLYAVTGHDAVMVFAAALKNCTQSTQHIPEYIQQELYSVNNVAGISGLLTIDKDGVIRSITERMFEYKNGEIVEVVG
ncbi:MAG: ABC transporter substrate-binding protein [Candidatus Woesearchaeota archaeon]|nr:ABC transporter substrate-binding protein [Candidatus Woesearchaeota archaeon]